MENLDLWLRQEKTSTEKGTTKEVSYGSRKFTAIDAYHQIKEATKEWGEYGAKWGLKQVEYNVLEGRLFFTGVFYYPNGQYPIFNDIKIGDDCAKKVFTDSLTKALSYLGFNADIFMGQFEGNKYTTQQTESIATNTQERGNIVEGKCDRCGANAITSKAGKQYCKCWYN